MRNLDFEACEQFSLCTRAVYSIVTIMLIKAFDMHNFKALTSYPLQQSIFD